MDFHDRHVAILHMPLYTI